MQKRVGGGGGGNKYKTYNAPLDFIYCEFVSGMFLCFFVRVFSS